MVDLKEHVTNLLEESTHLRAANEAERGETDRAKNELVRVRAERNTLIEFVESIADHMGHPKLDLSAQARALLDNIDRAKSIFANQYQIVGELWVDDIADSIKSKFEVNDDD